MSFFDDVTLANGEKVSASGGGSFFDTLNILSEEQSNKIASINKDVVATKAAAKKANSLGTIIKETIVDTAKKVAGFGADIGKNTWQIYQQTPGKILDDINESAKNIESGARKIFSGDVRGGIREIQKGGGKAGLRTAGDMANAIFAPISAAIGSILTSTGGQELQDHLGEKIADKSGITDMPKFQQFALQHPNFAEDFNRLMNVLMSGYETGTIEPRRVVGDIQSMSKRLLNQAKPVEPKNIPVKSETPGERSVPIQTSKTKQADYAKSQGYEPYTSPDQLPTIDMGKPAAESLPVIQVGESVRVTKNSKGDYVYEPIREPVSNNAPIEAPAVDDSFFGQIETPTAKKTVDYTKEPNLDGTVTSKIASDIANEIGISVEGLPASKRMNMVEEANKSLQLISEDPARAKRIAMGDEQPRNGEPRAESIFTALRKTGDVDTLIDLVDSKITTMSQELGRRIKALDTQSTSIDPVSVMQDIKKARTERYKEGGKQDVESVKKEDVASAEAEIAKEVSRKSTLEDFIKKLRCND